MISRAMAAIHAYLCWISVGLYWIIAQLLGRRQRNWRQEKIVICGGSGALGGELAQQLQALGANVQIVDIVGGEDVIHCDVTEPVQVARVFEEITDATILVNAMGLVYGKPLTELSHQEIEASLKTNIHSFFLTCKHFLTSHLGQKTVVNVSSCLGLAGVAEMTDYCASKFAVFGLTESLRREHPQHRFITVCPFLIRDVGLFQNRSDWCIKVRHPWLIAPLSCQQVATQIIQAIDSGKSELYLPKIVNIFPISRVLPTTVQDWIHQLLGSNDSKIHIY